MADQGHASIKDMLDALAAATFGPLLGTVFTVQINGVPVALRLAEVDEGAAQPAAPRTDPFSLLFTTSAAEAGLAQGTYSLTHDLLGELELFLVPRAPGADGLARLEAVFN